MLQASRRMSIRSTRFRRLLITPVILLAALAMASILNFDLAVMGYMAWAAGAFAFMLILLLIVDYAQQLIPSERIRTGLVWYTFAATAITYALNRGFFPRAAATEAVSVIFYISATIAGIWLILAIGSMLLDRLPPRLIIPLLGLFGIEPAIRMRRRTELASSLDN